MALIKRADVTNPNSNVVPLAVLTAGSPVTTLPSASRYEGGIIFVDDAVGGSPTTTVGMIAVSNGTDWINLSTGEPVAPL